MITRFKEVLKKAQGVGLAQQPDEAFNLWRLCVDSSSLGGSVAEFGVWRGATALILSDAIGGRDFHLFDSFGGMPDVNGDLDTGHKKGDFSDCSIESVRNLLGSSDSIKLHAGLFSETSASVSDAKFSFVHLDADIYDSTIEGLRFFFPRLVPGGMLVAHDYEWYGCPGVKVAFDEFFGSSEAKLEKISTHQMLVVKP